MTLLRVGIVVAIILTLAVRMTSRENYIAVADFDARERISQAVLEAGATVVENPVDPNRIAGRMVYFNEPGCTERSVAFAFLVSADTPAISTRINGPVWSPRILYFEKVMDQQDRLVLFATWLRERALSLTGSSEFLPISEAVFYSAAPDCAARSTIDWQSVWRAESTS